MGHAESQRTIPIITCVNRILGIRVIKSPVGKPQAKNYICVYLCVYIYIYTHLSGLGFSTHAMYSGVDLGARARTEPLTPDSCEAFLPLSQSKWKFPKIRGTFFGVLIIRIPIYWGLNGCLPIYGCGDYQTKFMFKVYR